MTTLSFVEKLDHPCLLPYHIWHWIHCPNHTIQGKQRVFDFRARGLTAVTRNVAGRFSIAQLQHMMPSSSQTFRTRVATQKDDELSTEQIDENGKLHWIGSRKSEKVLLHIHGGGYPLPLNLAHLKLLAYFRDSVRESTGFTISIAVLEYIKAPQSSYPTQFRQANAALHHLLASGIPAGNIVLSGDSAGGHIALCLVSHLLRPHPSVPPPPILSAPLAGVFLISPRVTSSTSAPSFAENSHRDSLNKETLSRWFNTLRSNSAIATEDGLCLDGHYTEPDSAPEDWWAGLQNVVGRVFVSVGEYECFRDAILEFSQNWKKCEGIDLTCFVEKQGIHDSPLMDIGAGRPPTDLLLAAGHWLASVVESR